MSVIIAPSILSCDFGNLERDFQLINRSQADWFHVDVMDGVFVPNISFGFPIIEALKKVAEKPLDVHIMISNPDQFIAQFAKSGAEYPYGSLRSVSAFATAPSPESKKPE